MSDLITAVAVKPYLGLPADNTDHDAVLAIIISGVSEAVISELRCPVIEVEYEDLEISGSGTSVLYLPAWPVSKVESVEEDGVELHEGKDKDFRLVAARGILVKTAGVWRKGTLNVIVSMTAGYKIDELAQFLVDATNNKINFDEGGAELTATVDSGAFSGAALAVKIAAALNAAEGKSLTYTCSFSTVTGKFTISSTSAFTIRWKTGTNKATDISALCGYLDDADDSGAASYLSDSPVGTPFMPKDLQFMIMMKVAREFKKQRNQLWGEGSRSFPDGSIQSDKLDNQFVDGELRILEKYRRPTP